MDNLLYLCGIAGIIGWSTIKPAGRNGIGDGGKTLVPVTIKDGEGIRYEIVAFARAIEDGKQSLYISQDISEAISGIIGAFYREEDVVYI